jgi:hypothetical protein
MTNPHRSPDYLARRKEMPHLEGEEVPCRMAATNREHYLTQRRARVGVPVQSQSPTQETSTGSTTSSGKSKPATAAAAARAEAIAVAGVLPPTNDASGNEGDSKHGWITTEEGHGSERFGAAVYRGSEDASRGKEDRDRIQLAPYYEHDGAAHTSISSAAKIPTNDDGVARLPSDAASGRQDSEYSEYSSIGAPIMAQLAPSEDAVEAKVANRLKIEMEERLQHEVAERMEKERGLQVVVEAVEVRGVNEDDEKEDDDICGFSRTCFFVVIAMILIVAVAGVVAGAVLGTREDKITLTTFPTASPTAFPTRYTTSDFDGLLKRIGPLITDNIQTLQDPTTPQYVALDWLANVDGYDPSADFVVTSDQIYVERYVLALLYFSTNGKSWNNQYNFTLPTSICDWYDDKGNGVRGVFCNDLFYVEQLLIRKFWVTFDSLD